MIKKYYLKDIDVSQLPLPLREEINKEVDPDCAPVAMVGYFEKYVEPIRYNGGEYFTIWVLSSADKNLGNIPCYWLKIARTPWVSPRVDKYLESIRINKMGSSIENTVVEAKYRTLKAEYTLDSSDLCEGDL